jgi:hypothetical protein
MEYEREELSRSVRIQTYWTDNGTFTAQAFIESSIFPVPVLNTRMGLLNAPSKLSANPPGPSCFIALSAGRKHTMLHYGQWPSMPRTYTMNYQEMEALSVLKKSLHRRKAHIFVS